MDTTLVFIETSNRAQEPNFCKNRPGPMMQNRLVEYFSDDSFVIFLDSASTSRYKENEWLFIHLSEVLENVTNKPISIDTKDKRVIHAHQNA
jgi:hypothetical protein